MTNADKIRNMTDEKLPMIIMCPYDTAGKEIMPCVLDGKGSELQPPGGCYKCIDKWLKKEADTELEEIIIIEKTTFMQRFTRSE